MDAASWAGIFQRIPPEKEDHLVIVTTTGIEIIIQKILRVEADYLILKGRLSGATDAARAVLMPFSQINNLAINKQLLETDVLAAFGFGESGSTAPSKTEVNAAASQDVPPAKPSAELDITPPPAKPAPASRVPARSGSSGPPSKSIFLERLRARLGTDSSKTDKS